MVWHSKPGSSFTFVFVMFPNFMLSTQAGFYDLALSFYLCGGGREGGEAGGGGWGVERERQGLK